MQIGLSPAKKHKKKQILVLARQTPHLTVQWCEVKVLLGPPNQHPRVLHPSLIPKKDVHP